MIGPNGAGKTTMFNIIAGVYPATSGNVEFLGKKYQYSSHSQSREDGDGQNFSKYQTVFQCQCFGNVLAGCHNWSKSQWLPIILGLQRQRKTRDAVRIQPSNAGICKSD